MIDPRQKDKDLAKLVELADSGISTASFLDEPWIIEQITRAIKLIAQHVLVLEGKDGGKGQE